MTSSTGGGSWFEGSDGSSGSPTALRFLHELSALIAGSENLNKALRATLERICTVCAWPYGEAWIADEATQTLRRGPAWDGQRHELMALAAATPNLALGEELPGAAFAAGQTVWWPDLRNVSSPRLGDALSLGLRAGVAVPMIAGARTVGVLVFFLTEMDHPATAHGAMVATLVARQLGLAIARKQSEDALRDSEERLRLLVQHVGDAVFMLDPDGRVLTWTPAAARILGYTNDETVDLTLADFYTGNDRAAGLPRKHLDAALASGRLESEGWRLTREGKSIWAQAVTCPIYGSDGLRGFAHILRDETDLRQTSELLAQRTRELERSNKELEAFASVASHDLQEPLRKIRTFSDRIKRRLPPDADRELDTLLDRMGESAMRMQRLIDELLEYSRVSLRKEPVKPIDLGVLVRDVLEDFDTQIDETGGRVEIGPLPVVEANSTQMRQLFRNLISNALKFVRPEVPPVIHITSAAADDAREHIIRVEDNGIGFEPKYSERIFGLLQRLHGRSEYEGTGMGLAICRKIAERHDGSITAEGHPGQGSTFFITLPNLRTRSFCYVSARERNLQ